MAINVKWPYVKSLNFVPFLSRISVWIEFIDLFYSWCGSFKDFPTVVLISVH